MEKKLYNLEELQLCGREEIEKQKKEWTELMMKRLQTNPTKE